MSSVHRLSGFLFHSSIMFQIKGVYIQIHVWKENKMKLSHDTLKAQMVRIVQQKIQMKYQTLVKQSQSLKMTYVVSICCYLFTST